MNTKELREKILEAKETKWFKTIEIDFQLSAIDFSKTFKGFSEFHKFLELQVQGFEKVENLPPELKASKSFFDKNIKNLEAFLNRYHTQNEDRLNSYWRSVTVQNTNQKIDLNNKAVLIFNSGKTELLLKINDSNPAYVKGAFNYFINNNVGNKREDFVGALFAYEFENPKSILSKKSIQNNKLQELSERIENQLSENEVQLLDHLESSKKEYQSYIKDIDDFKNQKENFFNKWFDGDDENEGVKKEIDQFFNNSKERRENLEIAYDKKLELSKPARYWKRKAETYFENYKTARTILLILIGITAIFLGAILVIAPDYIFNKVFNGNEVPIVRWSLTFIALLALMAYAIKAVNKIMFSSLHLSRDAEERHALTFVYLSLLNEQGSDMDNEDRKLILQSLFSRSDTGLLKDDSGPTMPNDFISKLMNK